MPDADATPHTAASAPSADTPSPPPAFVLEAGADHPLAGVVLDGTSGDRLTPAQALARLRGAEVVLLGEQHDNPDHHALQAYITRQMIAAGRRPALVLEMIDAGQDQPLADWRHKPAGDRAIADLGEALAWEKRGWPDFAMYAPILDAAMEADLPILPGNLPAERVRAIARGGADTLSAGDQSALGLDDPLPSTLQDSLIADLQQGHCGMLPEQALPAMALAQRARDGRMAQSLRDGLSLAGVDGALLIAGAGHTRRDRGVPYVLSRLDPDRDVLSVGFIEVPPTGDDDAEDDWLQSIGPGTPAPFDLVWVTPRVDRPDPCEALRRHFGKHGAESDGK